MGLLPVLLATLLFGAGPQPPVSGPAKQETVAVIRGQLLASNPVTALVYVRNSGAVSAEVSSVVVEGRGEDREPVVRLRNRSGSTVIEGRQLPAQSGLSEDDEVVIEARFNLTATPFGQVTPAKVYLADGRVIDAELRTTLVISPVPRSERVPAVVPPGRRD